MTNPPRYNHPSLTWERASVPGSAQTKPLKQEMCKIKAKPLSLFPSFKFAGLLALGPLLFLTACAQARPPLEITKATVSPDPLIGQVATLHVEFVSRDDEPLTTLEIFLSEGIKLVKGDLTWRGSLTANQPQTHDISICTEFQGNYSIGMRARSWHAENDIKYTEAKIVLLDITQTHAQVFTSENLADRILPTSTFGPAILPTALPQDWVSPCP